MKTLTEDDESGRSVAIILVLCLSRSIWKSLSVRN